MKKKPKPTRRPSHSVHLRLSPDEQDHVSRDAEGLGVTSQAVIKMIVDKHYGIEFVEPRRGWQGRKCDE